MTKKDYISIARMFADLRKHSAVYATADMAPFTPGNALIEVSTVEGEIARIFAADNVRFDRARFLNACQGR